MKPPRKYEGSAEDRRADIRGARSLRMTLRNYEKSPRDRREDRLGQQRLEGKDKRK